MGRTYIKARAGAFAIAGTLAVTGICGVHAQGIPTGGAPSPTGNAQPWSQQMMRFEEFGTKPMVGTGCSTCTPVPPPQNCTLGPQSASIDTFLKQALKTAPTRLALTTSANPWEVAVEGCLGSSLAQTFAEGRPTGEWFAHQRWSEFAPKVYFQTAQAGARKNGGLRDTMQRHRYKVGEFKPGGLYYNGGTTKNTEVRFHPSFAVQNPNSVWTFDGTMPPKLLMARYGEPLLFRHYNMLPINANSNNGFGLHTITTHEHNGHNPAESDGYASAFFFPGQFYDYHWPMQLAGYDTINTGKTTDWAGFPNGSGGVTRIRGDWKETMSTHWFHDHMLDFTAQNVYKGNAAMMNYYSSIDRGREGFKCNYTAAANPNMCFPSGTSLDWGNRDYDVNLLIADKAWGANGQLFFNPLNLDGFIGDQMLVNWTWKPNFNVRARRYRFRILNGSVSRYFKLALVTEAGQRVPFHMIANDGNIMEHAVAFPNAQSQDLPTQSIAERYDIVVNFAGRVGQKLYLVNLMEHVDGAKPNREIPLADVLSGAYQGDPAVGRIMQFTVVAYTGTDLSMNPADYVVGGKKMIPKPTITPAELTTARVRTFNFGKSNGTDTAPWTIKTDGGQGLGADMHRVSAAPKMGSVEIWRLINDGSGWSHPVHIHFEEGQILSRDGAAPPAWEQWARKDVYRLGPEVNSSMEVQLAIRFREFAGTYMEHCHNTQHEDHAMLMRWDATKPGATVLIPTPRQTWEGTFYEPSFSLATAN
jgi:FtsP/CotA-like multicopper oxidase with cupredoxin domain